MGICRYLLLAFFVSLAGCSNSSDTSDLKQFVDKTLSLPRGRIEPIPVFKPYEFFNYSAAGLRSPFELPVIVDTSVVLQNQENNIAPDFDRVKEQLEQSPLGELTMVGSMKGGDQELWALIQDSEGNIVRVKAGNYMGQNHGRIQSITDYSINLIEIVPNGSGGWIERPKTISLNTLGEG